MLPKSVDIAKVISDDATGDEKGLEELPEASVKKFVVFLTVKFLILSTGICNKKNIGFYLNILQNILSSKSQEMTAQYIIFSILFLSVLS